MIYGTIEQKQKEIRDRAEALRLAAAQIGKVKQVVKSFDGKVYNCRFDEAISALTDEESRFYCSNQYGWFYIQFSQRHGYNKTMSLLSGYSCKTNDYVEHQTRPECILFDGKRINADVMMEALNKTREALLKEAFEIDCSLECLDDTMQQLEALKGTIENIVGALPSIVLDVYGLHRYCTI